MRHLVTVSRSMLATRHSPSGTLAMAKQQIMSLSAAARENNETASSLLEGSLKDKSRMSEEAELQRCATAPHKSFAAATHADFSFVVCAFVRFVFLRAMPWHRHDQVDCRGRGRLEVQDGALCERLEKMHGRRRELQEELDRVMGEILAAEQQQVEVRRERESLERMVAHKVVSLEDTMQALSVQMQDYDNEEDALEEAAGFFGVLQAMVEKDAGECAREVNQRMMQVMVDQVTLAPPRMRHSPSVWPPSG